MAQALLLQGLTGLAGASSLFLIAAGLTVIFGVVRIVNFAHGSLTMLGAYIGWSVLVRLPPSLSGSPGGFILGVLITAIAVAGCGLVLEVLLLRRVYASPALFQLLATFGALLIIQDLVQRIWGPEDLSLSRPPWLRQSVAIMGGRFPLYDLVLIGVGPAVLLLLWLVFTHTRWGALVRAATEDREMLGALGVNQTLLFSAVFALGSALAGLGGVLALPDHSANLQIDLTAVTDAFVVVVTGGLGSVPGAYLAAVVIGVLQAYGILFLPGSTLVLGFAIMAVVLAVRPQGLLGRVVVEPRSGAAPLLRPTPPVLRMAGVVALVAAVAAPFAAGPYATAVLTEAAIAMLFAASLHLLMGPGGMPSFGHAAWFGLGAYAAALAAGGSMLGSLALAPVVAGLAGLMFAALTVRLAGVYLAMITLAFAQIVWAGASQWDAVTGGDNGILNVWPRAWVGTPARFYWLVLGVTVAGTLALRLAIQAPFGFALRAVRDSPARAGAIGINAMAVRIVAFGVSAAAAGLAGALFVFAKGSVFPGYAGIPRSVDALAMVLLGGLHTLSGPIVGALVYTGLYDSTLASSGAWRLVLGGVIILLVLAFPHGIVGGIAGAAGKLRRAANH